MNARAKFRQHAGQARSEDWQLIGGEFMQFTTGLPARVIKHLQILEGDYGGFPIDRYSHSLQTATRALRDGRDEEYVVCALLHDIGDTLGTLQPPRHRRGHPEALRERSQPLDGAAPRHLPGPLLLPPHRPGPRPARELHAATRYYERTAEFCELYDNPAFDPKAETLPISEFEPMLRRVMAQPKQSIYKAALTEPAAA